jgi:hypothetical protein
VGFDAFDSEVLVSLLSHPTQPPVNRSSKAAVDAWQARQWSVILLPCSVATLTDIRSDTTGAVVLQFTHRGLGSQAVAVTGSDMNVVELDIV